MSYLRTFLPWIVYAVIPSSDWKWAALAGLIVSIVVTRGSSGRAIPLTR